MGQGWDPFSRWTVLQRALISSIGITSKALESQCFIPERFFFCHLNTILVQTAVGGKYKKKKKKKKKKKMEEEEKKKKEEKEEEEKKRRRRLKTL